MLRVRRNGQLINKYTYDQTTGFLIREDNADTGISYTYTYDTVGNILSRRSYSFTVGDLGEEIEYTAKEWNYIGINFYGIGERSSSFYYDAMGNVTWDYDTSYTWNGRELTSYFFSDVLHTYSYNSDGIRTDKVREEYGQITETVHYVLDGSTIVAETRKDEYGTVTHQLYYYYDENGAPIGLNWNGQDYYYYKNIFGDVLGIFNSAGTLVVRYSYDAWGNSISRSGSMANTLGIYNPFRYRGYYLDTETGMYYLNARYYNPSWCRFISPDPVIDTGSAVGCNPFTYCGNDPVNRIDVTGLFWGEIWSGIKSFVGKVIDTVKAIGEAVEYEIGIGVGLGGEFNVGDVELSMVIKEDVINLQDAPGEEPFIGYYAEERVSFGGDFFDGQFTKTKINAKHSWQIDDCDYTDVYNCEHTHSTDYIVHTPKKDNTIFSAQLYIGVGATVSVGFDAGYLINRWSEIWLN